VGASTTNHKPEKRPCTTAIINLWGRRAIYGENTPSDVVRGALWQRTCAGVLPGYGPLLLQPWQKTRVTSK
jgi:hypothetical protein